MTLTEEDFLANVIDLAHTLGYLAHHCRPARSGDGWATPIQGDAGFVDLVLARRGRVVFAELKSEQGRVTPAQSEWLDALGGKVWRPSDIQIIADVLGPGRS